MKHRHNRMVPRIDAGLHEVELECICGDWIPYPINDEASVCPRETCGTGWNIMEPTENGVKKLLQAARGGDE